jgi:predicted ester cyclase
MSSIKVLYLLYSSMIMRDKMHNLNSNRKMNISKVIAMLTLSLLLVVSILFAAPSAMAQQQQQTTTTTTAPTTTTSPPLMPEEQQQSLQEEDSSQEEENNKAIIIAFTNASNDRNYAAIEQYVAENIIEHRPGVQSGRNSTIEFLQSLATAFPDFHTNIDHIVAEGDRVVVFTTTNGTHEGEFIFAPGVPPTGKQVSFKSADMYRISNDQMVEHWDVIEILDMMTQIGAITFSQPSVPTMPNSPANTTTMATPPNNVTSSNISN